MKTLIIGPEAAERAVGALKRVSDAVGSTLGPGGRPAFIDKYEAVLRNVQTASTKDGVTLLDYLKFIDPVENAVHSMCLTAARHAVMGAGDGTTSTIVLAHSLADAIWRQNKKTPQAYGRYLRREIDKCIDAVDDYLIDPKDVNDLVYKVAKTSSNGDEEMAKLVQDVVSKCSKYSNISITKNPSSNKRYSVEKSEGYAGGNGFYRFRKTFTAYDQKANDSMYTVIAKRVGVVLWNGNINSFEAVEKAMHQIFSDDAGLMDKYDAILFAGFSVDDSVNEKSCAFNRSYAKKILLTEVKTTSALAGYGYQVLLDLQAFTGATIYDPVQDFDVSKNVGECGEIHFSHVNTLFLYRAKNNTIKERCKFVDQLLQSSSLTQYERDVTKTRNSELAEGLTSIIVGDGQLAEIQERADRLDDAVRAAQSVKSGVVAGGGLIYARIAEKILEDDFIKEAMSGIVKKVIDNYGVEFNPKTDPNFMNHLYALHISDNDTCELASVCDCDVVDSATAVKSVLKQASILAVLVTTTGCMSLDGMLKEREQLNLYRSAQEDEGY